MKDYYKILGINNKADFRDVINAYNNSIKYFNNKTGLSDNDKLTIKEIKEAYFVLGNYHNRRQYDNNLEGFKKPDSDIFSDRIFFRPNLDYDRTNDSKLRNTTSDIMNNKKNRIESKKYSNWIE